MVSHLSVAVDDEVKDRLDTVTDELDLSQEEFVAEAVDAVAEVNNVNVDLE